MGNNSNEEIKNIREKVEDLGGKVESLKKEVQILLKPVSRSLIIREVSKLLISFGVLIFGGFSIWKIISLITPDKSFLQNLPPLILAIVISASVVTIVAIMSKKED